MNKPLYVIQDGREFHVCTNADGDYITRTNTAPFSVDDGNVSQAYLARAWFEEEGYFKGAEADYVVYL